MIPSWWVKWACPPMDSNPVIIHVLVEEKRVPRHVVVQGITTDESRAAQWITEGLCYRYYTSYRVNDHLGVWEYVRSSSPSSRGVTETPAHENENNFEQLNLAK